MVCLDDKIWAYKFIFEFLKSKHFVCRYFDCLLRLNFFFFFLETNIHTREKENSPNTKIHHNFTQKF